ncbi:Zn(2)-C6 fungal-type domain-containing protein [Mycena sanguinolenta]|uniref:Zn(2)-C6 fungal-type domain-containing protein n=1 Tax=Mycena sanguinolenta TaxID=230812 RepID=A0A8H6XWE8_9AGAR|nr:Zn(2)-C6 fungal-type domain-containing protein [Mycena sanguinolenta]
MPKERRVRGPYSKACNVCRTKKSKCDGVKPVCGSCSAAGRDDECSWDKDIAATKNSKAHFEALRKRVDAFEAYVLKLEEKLAKCICQDVSTHLQFRPQWLEEQSEDEVGDSDVGTLDSDEEITQELTVPTPRIQLDDSNEGPLLHGAYFRLGNKTETKPSNIQESVADPTATYVLQVGDVDISQSHPDLDWSRHLPPEVAFERREHDKIIELSFNSHTLWPIIPSLFLRDMYRALSVPRSEEAPKTPHYSPMLHNAILSLSTVFSDDPYLRDLNTRRFFTQRALAGFDFKKPDSSMVHALTFIATFYTDCGDRIPAELYFGMATRLCVTLGFGVDATRYFNAGLITHDEMTARNWAYWSVFTLDVTWALYWGLDFTGPPRRNTPMPFVDPNIDQIPWFYAPAKISPQANYLTLVLNQTGALCVIAIQIADVVCVPVLGSPAYTFDSMVGNNLRPSVPLNVTQVVDQVTKIDLKLNEWKSRLPPQLDITLVNRASSTPQRLMMHLAYWWCFITLHRPFFNRRIQAIQLSDPEVDHVKLCIRAAENVLELVETWSSLYTMRLASLKMSGVIFSAGTVFFLRALQATGELSHCAQRTKYGASGGRGVHTGMLNDRLKPVITRRLVRRGEPIPAAATSLVETGQPAPVSNPEPDVLPGKSASSTTSYAPEWDSQLDPASAWSEILGDLDFFAQMQVTTAEFDHGSSHSAFRSNIDLPEMNECFLPTSESFLGWS